MTAFEMITQTFANLNITPTNDLRTQYNAVFLDGLNKGYLEIADRLLRPSAGEAITLDEDVSYDTSGLTDTLRAINYVSQYQDGTNDVNYRFAKRYDWMLLDDGITLIVPMAEASATVWLNYEFIPALLKNPAQTTGVGATSPGDFFPEQYHNALTYKATAAYWRALRSFERVDEWENTFYSAISKITPKANFYPSTVVDVYGGMML